MTPKDHPLIRDAEHGDVTAICSFGEAYIPLHYRELVGGDAAAEQVRHWWNATYIGTSVDEGLVVVAEVDGQLAGVGQRGRAGADHVIYKLYVHPRYRGRGLGPQLIDGLIRQLPPEVDRLCVEQFAANVRAGEFYEREGFTVERIQPSVTNNPALAQVWRARSLLRNTPRG